MRILPKRAFRLEVGLERYQCTPGRVQDVDDRFAASPMYKLGVAAGDIAVIGSAAQLRAVENDPEAVKPRGKK